MKICSKCKEYKELIDFSVKKSSIDGRRSCCKLCDKQYRLNNLEKIKEYQSKLKDVRRANYWKNHDKFLLYKRNYTERNREKISLRNREWALNNPEKKYHSRMKYYSDKINATPKWLSDEQVRQLIYIYKKAILISKETGIKYHVDHIIPLKGKTVCGLHVPWNLQILTAEENMKKGNKYE